MDDFREWLNAEIKKRGITQRWLAKQAGLSEPTITNICKGHTKAELKSKKLIKQALGEK